MVQSTRILAVGAITLGACAPALAPHDGMITHDGTDFRRVTDDEAALCEAQFCEPNFIYTAEFGRSRPKPVPTAQPKLPAEQIDYSREILRAPEAWQISEGSREVVVAVIDSGVDYNHPDLKNNIWSNTLERYGRAGVDDDGNGYIDDVYGWDFANNRPNGMDDNNHGTHCAGIIGAEKNGVGVVGISPKVKIMPLKFLAANGSGDLYSALLAIRYAARMGARVISNSWGGGGYSQLMNQVIQEAVSRGVLVVAAAGNAASNNDSMPTYPANYPGVISVASSDQLDAMSGFSNYGSTSVMIAAPGAQVLSTIPGSKFAVYSGTSMAAPQVSGALALALSVAPSADAEELKDRLCSTSVRILTEQTRCGRMDVAAFVASMR